MKLKESNNPSPFVVTEEAPTKNKRNPLGIIILLGVLYSLTLFLGGALSAENNIVDLEPLIANSKKPVTTFKNQVGGFFSDPDHVHIDISHKHFQKLAYKRDVALMLGRLIAKDDDFVPADIRLNGHVTPVKLRLKGDLPDHIQGNKWSFRVKVKGDNVLYGMEEFSIQHPKTRNYLAEWLYHEALKREDIISLRYDFIEVSINGKNQGIFAIEEHFNSNMIEYNERRAGPIIRLSEEQMWEQHDQIVLYPESKPLSSAVFNASHLDAFESKAIASDSVYQQQFIRAATLFEALRSGKMMARDVFDIERLANYLAVTEVMGAHHSAIWNHMRFYYNPISSKLEPIGFDGNAGTLLTRVTTTMGDFDDYVRARREIFYYVSMDPLFDKLYRKALHRVSHPSYLNSLYEEAKPGLDQKLRIIHKSYPDYAFPFDVIESNRKLIYHVINPADGLRIHFKERQQNTLTFQVGSTQALPAQLDALHMVSGEVIPFTESPELPGRKLNSGIAFKELHLAVSDPHLVTDSTLALARASYSIPGVDSLLYVPIFPYPQSNEEIIENDPLSNGSTAQSFDFLITNDQDSTVAAPKGTWSINQNLITPAGYTFKISPGTTFDLTNGAAIIIRGPVHFEGTSSLPIHIVSTDSTGQGLLVLDALGQSQLRHTRFTGLGNLDQFGWAQTGSVTFYESAVSLSNVTFEDNASEDALNIVRTSYQMDSVYFSQTYSDAFDADFSNGIITNSVFEHPGNDGIDVSGSSLTLKNVRVIGAGDKALSAGEFSVVDGNDLEINESEIAIASKDNSAITLTRVLITDSRLGVALFQKKPEFGPASLEANEYVIRNIEVPSLIEEGSLFMVNGERIPANNKNVSDLLYGNLYGTASN